MKTLTEISNAAAFTNAAATVASLDYAELFTARFKEVENLPAVLREAEMLKVQFPRILQAPEPGDLFAGRIRYDIVGLSPEACGLGYYCSAPVIRQWLDSPAASSPARRAQAEKLLAYWQGRGTAEKVRAAYPTALANTLSTDNWTTESGVAFPLYRMAGTNLDYAKLLDLGLDGLAAAAKPPVNDGDSFHLAAQSAINTVRSCLDYYISLTADTEMVRTLRAVRHQAPRTFREAIQLLWIYALIAGTWNYGRLDIVLGPFLDRDINEGRINESQALDLLCSLWRLMHGYSNQYNNRVFIGGKGRSDENSADRFALLAIEATRRVRLNQPQLSMRFYSGQNPALWERALDAIGEGCTFPMLYNDDVNIAAVAKAFNVTQEMAVNYTPFGCGEYVLGHYSVGTPSGVINLLKALEIALHGGLDPLTGVRLLKLPPAAELTGFEDVWNTYARVVEHHVAALAEQQKIEYDITSRETPLLLISLLTSDCMERGLSAFGGGARYLGGTLETYGNNNAADSLHVIDELVFRRKEIPLEKLVSALDSNFKGYEDLRKQCLSIKKYGNDEATADAMARRVHAHVCLTTRNQASRVGLHSYLVVIINNWANTLLGWKTSASAEGRLAGEPMANGNNPAPGSDISGATAFLNSLVSLDPSIHAGAVQNMKFGKEWFLPELRPKFDALLRTYFQNGGTQAMITVVSRDDLEAAMCEPEKWGHLMVRVGGFSIRFVDLPVEAQREVLARTLH